MATLDETDKIQEQIQVITDLLASLEHADPDRPYYQLVLDGLHKQLEDLRQGQPPDAIPKYQTPSDIKFHNAAGPLSSASRKRNLTLADMPEPKRLSANPSPAMPGTPDPTFGDSHASQWSLPNRPAHNSSRSGFTEYIDLTGPASTPPVDDPFPELNNAFREDGAHPGPSDASNQEWMSETDLAQFLVTPGPVGSDYSLQQEFQRSEVSLNATNAFHQGSPVPYLPGHQLPPWGLPGSDSSEYGDFSLHTAEAESIDKMLETVQKNAEEDVPNDREQTPRIMKSTLKEYQKVGLTWLLKMEDGHSRGGILADEMGLGKTVQAIALICARPSHDPLCKTTLIIAPLALLRQWEKEIEHHVLPRHKLSVFTYWGKGKRADFSVLRQHDVVLTTFQTLTSEFNQKENRNEEGGAGASSRHKKTKHRLALLGQDCMWYRVILDEAHNIKNRNAKSSKACKDLQARYRLCMTGTPMMNSIDELYPLLRFLKVDRYSHWPWFSNDIAKPAKHSQHYVRKAAIQRVQVLLKAVMLRRQKTSEVDGKPILQLPPKHITTDNVEFSDDEHAVYKALETKSQIQMNKYLKQNSVSTNYANILVLLLRLRQACCHPHLINDLSQPATEGIAEVDLIERASDLPDEVVARLKDFDAFECPICLEADPNPTIIVPCGHTVCGVCVQKLIGPGRAAQDDNEGENVAKCPHCRGEIKVKLVTDYKHFCRAHCPDRLASEDQKDDDERDDFDSDPEEDEDTDEDVDDKGNLAGFVVSDEEDEEEPLTSEKHDDSDPDFIAEQNAQNPIQAITEKKKGKGKARAGPRKTLAQLKKESMRNKTAKEKYIRRLRKGWVPSAKILQLLNVLRSIRENDMTEKTLVFSQFTTLLDLIEVPLLQENFRYQRYDGSMSMEARADAVEAFMENPKENIMLVSLKAGNAGLNLWRASQVVILDPFWNPFVEDQAVDRAHRMPQARDVTVHRILVPETVEDRICTLQDTKREFIGQALDRNAAKSLTRLNIQELKGLFGMT